MRYATIISLLFIFCFSHYFFAGKDASKKNQKQDNNKNDLPLKFSEPENKNYIAYADTLFAKRLIADK